MTSSLMKQQVPQLRIMHKELVNIVTNVDRVRGDRGGGRRGEGVGGHRHIVNS